MKITINFGGSILNPDGINIELIKTITEVMEELKKLNHDVLVVSGGGNTARKYIKAGKQLNISNVNLDRIGILATRLNAQLLISSLGDLSINEPSQSFEAANKATLKDKIPV